MEGGLLLRHEIPAVFLAQEGRMGTNASGNDGDEDGWPVTERMKAPHRFVEARKKGVESQQSALPTEGGQSEIMLPSGGIPWNVEEKSGI